MLMHVSDMNKSKRYLGCVLNPRRITALVAALCIGVTSIVFLASSDAATFVVAKEAETGTPSSASLKVDSSAASGGAAIRFGAVTQPPPPPPPPPGGNRVAVGTAAQLTSALASAKPGDSIVMSDGTYNGQFNSTASGTAQAPITLSGGRGAIINGGSLGSGYSFSLGTKNSASTVSYWRLTGFMVTGGQKGMMFDNLQRSIIDNVLVQNIGQEGIHLRNNSSNNIVQNSTVTKTGQATQAYGEGIYVGSAVSNWNTFSQGKADRSNNNQILNNDISFTGAESMDIKEGTHAGIIRGNRLNGNGMCFNTSADCNFADSLLDIKGEGWTIAGNTGGKLRAVWKSGVAENDGFQVHVISGGSAEGSGNNNTFENNTLDDLGGFGFNIQSKATGTVLRCDNKVTNATKGFGNVACR